jgi:tRNA(His) guanylyltransferase
MKDNLGDRMKVYESLETSRRFMPSLPIYARIDGRGFGRFTRDMQRPFDRCMFDSMLHTTKILVKETHAAIGYVQSDEISLAWIPAEKGQGWFDGKISKITSVLAGMATAAFIQGVMANFTNAGELLGRLPHFDARVINMPNNAELANMFLWRNLDATKNSISMAASHYYSHRDLQGKSGNQKQEMLWQAGVNFDEFPAFFKRGVFVRRKTMQTVIPGEELARIPEKHRPTGPVIRSVIEDFDLPPLARIQNLSEVLFFQEDFVLRTG